MKIFTFPIDAHQARWAFQPIRSKHAAISTLIKTVKVMLHPTEVEPTQQAGTITLAVSKMSRLFYQSKRKSFSLAFPFQVRVHAEQLRFFSASHPQIDSRVTSEILALLDHPRVFSSREILDFADPICSACDIDTDIWSLFRDLLTFEDGYVRYDDDASNANGHRHPQHHIDLFYSQGTTFKTGLRNAISETQFLDILNIETDCHYLHSA